MTLRPFRLEVADDAEQLLDLGRGERRGRLVHDDEARLHRQRARDLDHLLLGDGEIADQRHRIDVEPDPSVMARVSAAIRRQLTKSFDPARGR